MKIIDAYRKCKVVTETTREPLTMEEIKSHLRIPLGNQTEDVYLKSLRKATRRYTEEFLGRALMKQTRRVVYDSWSTNDYLYLPYPPAIAMTTSPDDSGSSGTAICYKAATDGSWTQVSSTVYAIDTVSEPGRVVLDYNSDWPTVTLHNQNPIRIHYTCGYSTAPSGIPDDIRLAMLMTLAHWYENREVVVVGYGGLSNLVVSKTVSALLQDHRVWG